MDSSNVLVVKDNISYGFEEPISSAVNSLHTSLQSLVNKLAVQQKNRHPKKIVFVIDREEIQFGTEQFGELAKIVKIFNLDFSNAVESFKNQDLIGKGNLFIISCGLNTLITGTAAKICVQMKCFKSLNTYTVDPQISFTDLTLQALKLQEYILDNSTDDQVMFCDIIPINISSSVMRTCENKHSLRQTMKQEVYINFLSTINEYNKFVDAHCQIFRLKNLNLLNVFFPTKAYKATRPVDYLYDFNEVDDEHVFNCINEFIYNLFTEINVNMEEMPEFFVFKSVTKSKLSRTSTIKLFERVVIITTRQYAIYFEKFKCSQVKLTFTRSCRIDDIVEAIKTRKKFEPKRTLWLTHMEIFLTARFECSKMCSSCEKPLEVFIPLNKSSAPLADYLTKVQSDFDALANNINPFLNADSSFAVLPPFPPTYLVLEESRHEQYHKIDMERKMFSFISREALNDFKSFFSKLNKQLITLSLTALSKANISFQSIETYVQIVSSWDSYVDEISENILNYTYSVMYNQWVEHINKLLSENLEFEVNDEVKPTTVYQNSVVSTLDDLINKEISVTVNESFVAVLKDTYQNSFVSASDDKINNAIPITVDESRIVASSDAAPKTTNSDDNYDHIVFVCTSEEHSQIIPEEEGNAKNMSVVNVGNDLVWDESKDKFNPFLSKGFKKILFIIIGSFKVLGKISHEMYCLKQECTNPISYLQLDSDDTKEIVKKAKEKCNLFIMKLKLLFINSAVISAPLIFIKPARKPRINSTSYHERVHRSCLNSINFYVLGDEKIKWNCVCEGFNSFWSNNVHKNIYCYFPMQYLKKLLYDFKKLKSSTGRFSNSTNSDYYQRYKLLLGNMIKLMCPHLRMNELKMKSSEMPLTHSRPSDEYKKFSNKKITRISDWNTTNWLQTQSFQELKEKSNQIFGYLSSQVGGNHLSTTYRASSSHFTGRKQVVGYPSASNQVISNYYSTCGDHLTSGYTTGSNYSSGSAQLPCEYSADSQVTTGNLFVSTPTIDRNPVVNEIASEIPRTSIQVTSVYPTLPNQFRNRYAEDHCNVVRDCPSFETAVCPSIGTDVCPSIGTDVYPLIGTDVCPSIGTDVCPSIGTDVYSYFEPSLRSDCLNKIKYRSRSRGRRSHSPASTSSHRRRSFSKKAKRKTSSTRRKETKHRSKDRSQSRSRRHSSPPSRHKRRRFRSKSIDRKFKKKRKRTKSRSKSRSRSRASSRSKVSYSESSSLSRTSGRSHGRSKNIETISSDINCTNQPDLSVVNFSIKDALDLLDRISDKVGMLGPVLKFFIISVKSELDTNRSKALKIIKEEDNIILLKMTVDKLKKQLSSASLSEISLISKTIEWTTHLINYVEKAPKQEVNINLKAIAAASMSKSPEFTISLIRAALAYESQVPATKEEVNEIFLKVCSVQCDIMMND